MDSYSQYNIREWKWGRRKNFITAKLPIEIGRYKGEISLREKVVFKEKS